MTSSSRYIVGISGRSGSGKTTFVRRVKDRYPDLITLHTMDNYYRPIEDQIKDEEGFINFDLPSSFYRERFYDHLVALKKGEDVQLIEYDYTKSGSNKSILVPSKPIILVEGLFIFHYEEVSNLLDYKVMVTTTKDTCYHRRLYRDQNERNYLQPEINYRYHRHAEPAFQSFILPHWDDCDLIVDNTDEMSDGIAALEKLVDFKS